MELSEKELRRSGRSTRRASHDDDQDLGTSHKKEHEEPEMDTPKRPRRASVDGTNRSSTGSASTSDSGVDESKHSFRFSMTKDAFLKDLYNFMTTRGQPITKLPSLGYKELDLYLLYQLVVARGGMDEVTRKQEWKLVYQDLEIPTMSTSASYNTRTNYKKYLYLYELEHCNFPDKNRPKDAKARYSIGEYIRIVSSVFEGQVFYARILKCRFRDGKDQYYVHYNGWNNSHDEWMKEDVLDPLLPDEKSTPELLNNPPPSRSSKSNHLIYDSSVSEKIISNLVSAHKSPKGSMNNSPLSPGSPATFKKTRKQVNVSSTYFEQSNTSSEEEEAANELLMGMERYAASQRTRRIDDAYQPRQAYKPVETLRYPMRSDPGEDISKILEDKRDRLHEQDLIHRNRLHTHVLMGGNFDENEGERKMIAELLKSVKIKIEAEGCYEDVISGEEAQSKVSMRKSGSSASLKYKDMSSSLNDPRSFQSIQESLVNLQTSILATRTSYKHAMKALKKHHNIETLPLQLKKSFITTRRNDHV